MAGCANCYYLSPKVGTRGPVDSPFMIIGESPGIQEVVKRLPFVGDSGIVLFDTAAKFGGFPVEPFITNAIHCLPRLKDPDNLREACLRCNSRLLEEITSFPRKLILSLGGPALHALTDNYTLKITKERGKLFSSNLAELGILATVHPAFLLRGGGNYTQFERDIKYAIDLLINGIKARRLPSGTTYETLTTPSEVKDLADHLQSLPQGTQVSDDIETTGFNFQTDRILYLGIQPEPHKSYAVPGHLITNDLFPPNISLNWHNGKFDCKFLRYNGYSSARVDDDTLLLSYCLNERRGIHDLDQAASDWLGSVNHKDMVKEFYKGYVIDPITGQKRRRNLSDAPPELVEEYLARDLNDTYHLLQTLKPQVLKDPNLRKFYTQHLLPGSEYLLKLELNGILVDYKWVMENFYRLRAEVAEHEESLNVWAREVLGHEINPRSWQQVKKLLYGGLKLGPMSLSTDDDTLEWLPKHPAVKALQDHRRTAKSLGTYVYPLMQGDDRLLILDAKGKPTKKETVVYPDGRTHSNYLLHGTPTGRLACRDLNVQNIPRDPILRGQWVAPPGYIILEVDYSQAELRSLAALSRCTALMEIFLSGKDLHNEFSAYLFGPNFTKEEKMAAKTVNFGIPYGREAPSIANDPDLNKKMDVTVQLAQSWIDGWATRFPGAWEFIEKCAQAPIKGQTIITCFGNKKRPGVVSIEKLRNLQNESRNFPHQAIAALLTLRAGMELFDILRDTYDTHIVNTVHDNIVTYTPANRGIEHIQKVAQVIQDKMEEIPLRYKPLTVVPFKAEPELGWHWGNVLKFKEVEALYQWDIQQIPNYIAPH